MESAVVMTERVKGMGCIRRFFAVPGREVTLDELKALTPQDKKDLYEPCAKALGVELDNSW